MKTNSQLPKQIELFLSHNLRKMGLETELNQMCLHFYHMCVRDYLHVIARQLPGFRPQESIVYRAMNFHIFYNTWSSSEEMRKLNVILGDIQKNMQKQVGPLFYKMRVQALHDSLRELNLLDEYLVEFYLHKASKSPKIPPAEKLLRFNIEMLYYSFRMSTGYNQMSTVELLRQFADPTLSFSWCASKKGHQYWWKAWIAILLLYEQKVYGEGHLTPKVENVTVEQAEKIIDDFKHGKEPEGRLTTVSGNRTRWIW